MLSRSSLVGFSGYIIRLPLMIAAGEGAAELRRAMSADRFPRSRPETGITLPLGRAKTAAGTDGPICRLATQSHSRLEIHSWAPSSTSVAGCRNSSDSFDFVTVSCQSPLQSFRPVDWPRESIDRPRAIHGPVTSRHSPHASFRLCHSWFDDYCQACAPPLFPAYHLNTSSNQPLRPLLPTSTYLQIPASRIITSTSDKVDVHQRSVI